MYAPSAIETLTEYRRQQLLQEAARDRLARQAERPSNAHHHRPIGRLFAQLSMAAALHVTMRVCREQRPESTCRPYRQVLWAATSKSLP